MASLNRYSLERGGDLADGLVELQQNPFVVAGQQRGIDLALHLAALHLAEAAGVPELVAEVAAQLDVLLVEQHVLAQRRAAHGAEAQGVGAVLGDEFERVGRIAQALAHLAAQLVADDAGEIDVAERQVAHELVARHDHARDPEEDDVRPGDQVGRGVELLQRVRLLRPAHRGKRPEPGAEPGVEHVGVLAPNSLASGRRRRHRTSDDVGVSAPSRPSGVSRAFGLGLPIPHRHPMPPPKLAADAPVAEVVHPVRVGLAPALRMERDAALPRPPWSTAPRSDTSGTTARSGKARWARGCAGCSRRCGRSPRP